MNAKINWILICSLVVSSFGYTQSEYASKLTFLNGKTSTTIPFTRYKGWIILKVKVNNTKTLSLILDSGAPTNVLCNEKLINELNIKSTSTTMVQGSENKTKNAQIASDIVFTLGDIQISKATMIVGISKDILTGVDGIIGKCLFENAIVYVNWKASTLTIIKPETYQYKGTGNVLPLTILSSGHIATDILMENNDTIMATKAIIDLGNRSCSFTDNVKGKHLIDTTKIVRNSIVGFGANGPVMGLASRATIHIDNFVLSNAITTFRQINDLFIRAGAYCNIGLGVLERFNIVIDYTGRKLILEKNNHFDSSFTYNQSGIIIDPKREGKYILVAGTIPSSPAAIAGIQTGDKIVKANGLTATLQNLSILDNIITGKITKVLLLNIRRGSKKIKLKIWPKQLI